MPDTPAQTQPTPTAAPTPAPVQNVAPSVDQILAKSETPGAAERVFHGVDSVLNAGFMAEFALPIAAGGVSGLSWAAGKLHANTGGKIKGFADAVRVPSTLTQTVQLGDLRSWNTLKAKASAAWNLRAEKDAVAKLTRGAVQEAKGLGGIIKNANLSTGLWGGMMLAGGASGVAKAGREFYSDSKARQELEQDLAKEGLACNTACREMERQASNKSLTHLGVHAAASVASTAAGLYFLAKMHKPAAAGEAAKAVSGWMSKARSMLPMAFLMGGQMIPEVLAGVISPRDGFLPAYSGLRQAQMQGQRIPAQSYAELIKLAAPKHLQGVAPTSPLLQDLAKQYEAEQASPGKVIAEMGTNRFNERAIAAKQRLAAVQAPAAPAAHVAPAPQVAKPQEAKPTAHVAAMAHDGKLMHGPAVAMGV
jgi:hypothetical protein